jgi:aldehyde dehydrogenase (NAD+)
MTSSTAPVLARHWIGGQPVSADPAATIDVVNPATGAVIGAATAATADDVDAVARLAGEFPWTEQVANSTVVREPVGVVGAITPWNFPLLQMMGKVAPALMAGDVIVLKPSELTPLTARILAEETARAGVPGGVLNVSSTAVVCAVLCPQSGGSSVSCDAPRSAID